MRPADYQPSGDYYDWRKTGQPERPWFYRYDQSLVMKIFLAERTDEGRGSRVYLTFEQALEVIERLDRITCGAPKIVYLVGWQYNGHDSKYPAWGEVNQRLKRAQDPTALESLKWLMREGSKHHTYRYANGVPLAEGEDPLKVNWCELTVTDAQGKVLYLNGFITDFTLTDDNVAAIVASGRARWKIENENNNTLKTKGYHLEHNFGHGQKHLSSLLAAMNILAFLYHTFLSFTDERYRLIRAALSTRKTFFDDVRALTRYILFANWDGLMDFMLRGLEIGPYAKPG